MFLITKYLCWNCHEGSLTIVNKLQPRSFSEGDYVITQGDIVVDDAFPMITKGVCCSRQRENSHPLYEATVLEMV